MKLFYNPASPFVRKVLVCAHELGLADRLELDSLMVSPVDPSDVVIAANSLGKIPTLVLDDGSALFDSRVICEYLDSVADAASVFPAAADARWTALRLQALGDGICDTGVGLRYETFLRPAEARWPKWIDAQCDRLRRTFQQLEDQYLGDLNGTDIGAIAIGCALGYLDFRFPDIGWRDGRPGLREWFDTFSDRASMKATQPPAA